MHENVFDFNLYAQFKLNLIFHSCQTSVIHDDDILIKYFEYEMTTSEAKSMIEDRHDARKADHYEIVRYQISIKRYEIFHEVHICHQLVFDRRSDHSYE